MAGEKKSSKRSPGSQKEHEDMPSANPPEGDTEVGGGSSGGESESQDFDEEG